MGGTLRPHSFITTSLGLSFHFHAPLLLLLAKSHLSFRAQLQLTLSYSFSIFTEHSKKHGYRIEVPACGALKDNKTELTAPEQEII